jgi:hypothetical protein
MEYDPLPEKDEALAKRIIGARFKYSWSLDLDSYSRAGDGP